ncbi:MAG: glycerol-3-phosphate acyltransferase, partial [Chloroflexota bacterium]
MSDIYWGSFVVIGSYLVGAIPMGYLLGRIVKGVDIRDYGSGMIGATNVLRTQGRTAGVVTLLLDVAKAVFAVWLADRFTYGDPYWTSATALAVMAGHAFPIYLKFQGGKAVASF